MNNEQPPFYLDASKLVKPEKFMTWINIKDKLPEKHKEVLAFRAPDEIIITYLSWMLDNDPIWADEVSNYSHWMPLPNIPQIAENEYNPT